MFWCNPLELIKKYMNDNFFFAASGGRLQPAQQAGVAAGVGGLALLLATGRWPGVLSLACLAGWAAVAGARSAWQTVRQQAQQGQPLLLGERSCVALFRQ